MGVTNRTDKQLKYLWKNIKSKAKTAVAHTRREQARFKAATCRQSCYSIQMDLHSLFSRRKNVSLLFFFFFATKLKRSSKK